MLNTLTYNSVSTLSYATYLSGAGAYTIPKRDFSKIEIPGRNGDLIVYNNRFHNVKISYPVIMMDNYELRKRQLVHKFSENPGYNRLEDSFMPDYFRMAYFEGVEDSTVFSSDYGHFNLVFDCKPQLYLKTGEEQITIKPGYDFGETLVNPTDFEALPLIEITGDSNTYGYFEIGGDEFEVSFSTSETIIIDCELHEVYKASTKENRNSSFTSSNGNFPKIKAGENIVLTDDSVTSFKLTPRWWTI